MIWIVVLAATLGHHAAEAGQTPSPGPCDEKVATALAHVAKERDSYLKYRYGSAASAEHALAEHAKEAATTAASATSPDERRRAHLDAAFMYGRLAVLAAKCGRNDDSGRHFKAATDHLRQRGDERVTPALLQKALEELDSDWDKSIGIEPIAEGPRAEGCRPTRR
jgi:hypothetical protein